MKRRGLTLLTTAVAAVAAAHGGVSESARAAAVTCGETLTTSAVLAADLDCSATSATAVTLGAPNIKLDLGGHHLAVSSGQIGVLSSFGGDTVTNGSHDAVVEIARVADRERAEVDDRTSPLVAAS